MIIAIREKKYLETLPVVPSGASEYDDERDAGSKENPSGDVETAIVDPVRLVVKPLKWTRIHLGE